jgi:hypothetical protein
VEAIPPGLAGFATIRAVMPAALQKSGVIECRKGW